MIFPKLAKFLRKMMAIIEMLESKLLAGPTYVKQYIDFLRKEIRRYEALANEILNMIEQLQASLNLPSGIYVRPFKGRGGNAFFLRDLANSLSRGYPGAPPFHTGQEYVTGVVLMAGGSTEREVDSLLGFMRLLGVAGKDKDDGGIQAALGEFDTAVTGYLEEARDYRKNKIPAAKIELDDQFNVIKKNMTEIAEALREDRPGISVETENSLLDTMVGNDAIEAYGLSGADSVKDLLRKLGSTALKPTVDPPVPPDFTPTEPEDVTFLENMKQRIARGSAE
jgi:hypothetical protein